MTGPFLAHAHRLLQNGYSAVPIKSGTKKPVPLAWQTLCDATITDDEISEVASNYPDAGLGVAGGFGGLTPVDIDTVDAAIKQAIFRALPKPTVVKVGKRGGTLFFRSSTPIVARKFRAPNGAMLAEILTSGHQTIIPPTVHPETKKPYRYTNGHTLLSTHINELPEITQAHVAALTLVLAPWMAKPQPARKPRTTRDRTASAHATADGVRVRAYALAALAAEAKALSSAVAGGRNQQLFDAACMRGCGSEGSTSLQPTARTHSRTIPRPQSWCARSLVRLPSSIRP